MSLPEVCTPEQVAAYFQVPPRLIRKLCREDGLPHMPLSKNRIRIDRDDIVMFKERLKCEIRESISNTEKNEDAGKSSNISEETLSGTQLALAAVRRQTTSSQKSSSKEKSQKIGKTKLRLVN